MSASRTATCPSCNAEVSGESRYCPNCGAAVSGVSPSMAGSWPPGATAQATATHSPWDAVITRLRHATLGEFDIGRELGRGGMAAVFLAHDLALNRKVAIKVMSPGLLMGAGMIERFRQEAVTIANLQHAHIVTVHAVRQLEDLHFFVMQFIEGQSLEGVLRANHALSLDVARPMLYQVGTALAYAHRRGVVHRDIKPGNILLSGDGDALVTDFGIAKVAEGPTQTVTGMVVGTPSYMSPEQCHAKELDGKSDQYSLGIVAFQMLAGHVPFSGSAFAIMNGHTSEPVPSLRAIVPDLPESVEAAIVRMLAKKPNERFPTIAEALQALQARPVGEDSPVRDEIIRLAAVEERRAALGDLLRTPASPVPRSHAVPAAKAPPVESAPVTSAPVTPPPVTPAPVTASIAVAIAPLSQPLEAGDHVTLRATVRGATDPSALRWSSDDPGIAAVRPDSGLLYALSPGSTTVRATLGEATDDLTVQVNAAQVATVRLTPRTAGLRAGEQVVLVAEVLDRRKQPLERAVTWSARGDAVHVDASGTVTALMTGSATVTAACDGVQDAVSVEVRPMVAPAPTGSPPPVASVTEMMKPAVVQASPVVEPAPAAAPQPLQVVCTPAPTPEPAAAVTPPSASSTAASRAGDAKKSLPLLPIGAGVVAVAIAAWLLMPSKPDVSDTTVQTPVVIDAPVVTPPPSAVESTTTAVVEPPPVSAPPVAASAESAAPTRAVVPVLRVQPPVSTELRPAQTLRLRASLQDPASRAVVSGPIRFSTSDRAVALVHPTTGLVRAVKAGRVVITVDAGAAGRSTVNLAVVDPPPLPGLENVGGGGTTPPPVLRRDTPFTPPVRTEERDVKPTPAVAISQAQLASEARAVIESFAHAVESRNLGLVRAMLPSISSQYASDLSELFEGSKSVRVSLNTVSLARGATAYDATPGTRTSVTAAVTVRVVPVRGNALPPANDVWPVTLLREASGWKLVQVSASP
ncbi:MAG: protein kinase [Gemmatimonadota bacterium]